MHASHDDPRTRAERGPSIYYGYCDRERRYRLMDLPEFMSNVQQGMSRMMSDAQTAYQQMVQGLYGPASRQSGRDRDGEGVTCLSCGSWWSARA